MYWKLRCFDLWFWQGICNRHKLTSCQGIKLYVTNPKCLTLTFNQFCTSNRIYVIGTVVIGNGGSGDGGSGNGGSGNGGSGNGGSGDGGS